MEKDVTLNVENLVVQYVTDEGVVEAVNDISFTVRRKKTLGLVGETGAGKTTTALAIMRLIPDPPGIVKNAKIEIDGKDIYSLSKADMDKIRGKVVSMIFQDPMSVLNPVYTVGHQVAEAIELHEHVNKLESYKKAAEILEMVGIPADRINEYPHQFSGGMKQRVVIAIALACNPKLLIADEPTTALDVTIQAQVIELMKKLKEIYETAMIMITHDLGLVAEICDDVAVMYAGQIIEIGSLEEVFNNTLHPYTEGLFNSLPNINERRSVLNPIPGMMPDPTNLPFGCAFEPRCKYATKRCKEIRPTLKLREGTHSVACIAYDSPNFYIERSGKQSI